MKLKPIFERVCNSDGKCEVKIELKKPNIKHQMKVREHVR